VRTNLIFPKFDQKIHLCYTHSMMLNTYLKWLALIATLSGALCTSLRIDPMNVYLLNLGAILYLAWSIRIRELNLVLVNAGLLSIYIVGLFFG